MSSYYKLVQLLATDVLVSASMTNAANCDYSCELQNSVNHQTFERILRHAALTGTHVHAPFSDFMMTSRISSAEQSVGV